MNSGKTCFGVVVSDKMPKTRTVLVERSSRHPLYHKVLRFKKRYYAHDEENRSKIGNRVLLVETRPLSRLKRWRIVKVLSV